MSTRTTSYQSLTQCWQQDPAGVRPLAATKSTETIMSWADCARQDGHWVLAATLYLILQSRIMALTGHCVDRAAQTFQPPSHS